MEIRVLYIPFIEFQRIVCYTFRDMKPYIQRKFSLGLRRVFAIALVFVLLFSGSHRALADGFLFSIGDCSDEVFRVETRLSDLGYLHSVVNGRWESSDAEALSAFADANKVTVYGASDVLFTNDAIPASSVGSSIFATGPQGFLVTYGTRMPWSEVVSKLIPGQAYDVTSCYSGITLHMICVSIGSHAKMRPELDWDNATLRGFFYAASSSEKQPVVIAIDGILVAASIQQAAPSLKEQSLPEYGLYFYGSLSDINQIPDAEHEAIIHIAANQQSTDSE